MANSVRQARLTRTQKRLIVQGRLADPDAASLSDRAIARELGVSQPFVSAQRRLAEERRPASEGEGRESFEK